MAEDDRIVWRLANRRGIWHREHEDQGPWEPGHADGAQDRWNAGRCMDVLESPDGTITVAAETGGIWRMTADGDGTLCVSDGWAHHDFAALAQGTHADEHVFAGGAALYMTDVSRPVPFLDWAHLASLAAQVPDAGFIREIAVLQGSHVIVLACDGGVVWARIPPPPPRPVGCLGILLGGLLPPPNPDAFAWRMATVRGGPPGGFFSVAEGPWLGDREPVPREEAPIVETLMLGGSGRTSPAGPWLGRWEPDGTLVVEPAAMLNQGADVSLLRGMIGHTVVASCRADRRIGYAACANAPQDRLLMVMRTDDGGRHWHAIDTRPRNSDVHHEIADMLGNQLDHNLCIDVAPFDSDVVALGVRNTAVSYDAGRGWWLVDVNRQHDRVSDHLHADVSRVRFAARTARRTAAPRAFMQTSDGGVARVGWGAGAWVIESDRTEDGQHGNLYAVVLERNALVLYARPTGVRPYAWRRESVVTNAATGAGCLIQSSFQGGDAANGNLEVVVLEGRDLVHYWCAIRQGTYADWHRAHVVTGSASAPGCIIQSDFRSDDHGNFEVVVLEGSELVHYWHDNSDPGSAWHRGAVITAAATDAGCIMQSDFPFGGDHGNFEVVVPEGGNLVHYWHDNGNVGAPWSAGTPITNASTGPARLFQADYRADDDAHTNFELIVQEGAALVHWIRDNSAPGLPWVRGARITAPGRRASGPGCAFQGNFGTDDVHGNFELLAAEDGSIVHYWRDNGRPGFPWLRGATVSEESFTLRSDYNRALANLQLYPMFGTSMVAEGLVAAPTQDNGVVYGVSGPGGTPWYLLGGGDGTAAVVLAGRAPKLPALAAGRELVHEENDFSVGPHSAHWLFGAAVLAPDDHDAAAAGAQDVVPLLVPSPAVVPPPAPALGLRHVVGAKTYTQRYAIVEQPDHFPKGMVLAAIASQQSDLYALLVDQRRAPPDHGEPFPMHWEFANTLPNLRGDDPILAIASADGLVAFVSALTNDAKFTFMGPGTYWYRLFRVDLATGRIDVMPVDAALGNPAASSIAMASATEAYAAIGAKVGCWNGAQWVRRGDPPLAADESLRAVTVDYTTTPATVFAISQRRVYASRDGAATWVDASRGLPRSIDCQGLRWVRDPGGSRVYLATFGRSTWVADKREAW